MSSGGGGRNGGIMAGSRVPGSSSGVYGMLLAPGGMPTMNAANTFINTAGVSDGHSTNLVGNMMRNGGYPPHHQYNHHHQQPHHYPPNGRGTGPGGYAGGQQQHPGGPPSGPHVPTNQAPPPPPPSAPANHQTDAGEEGK